MSHCCHSTSCSSSHSHNGHDHGHDHDHVHEGHQSLLRSCRAEAVTLLMLAAGMIVSATSAGAALVAAQPLLPLLWYLVAVMPVGAVILADALTVWRRGDIFNEFTLMTLSCVGAFIIGEYPEGVAILLFYSFGEKLEHSASDKARERIRALINRMPRKVSVMGADGSFADAEPENVAPGSVLAVKPGERVAIDGKLRGGDAQFDLSAITGESMPVSIAEGAEVTSGAIPVDREVRVETTRPYSESTMSRIMQLIEDAGESKSSSETLLRKVTKWYTPAVTAAALLLFVVPWVVALVTGSVFDWRVWFERSLVLLVCSCPCAFVVSIPLSYFAAMGNASRMGVLFKGARWLDSLRGVDTLLLDKTGTLTTGEFTVSDVRPAAGHDAGQVLAYAAALDRESTHPLGRAICREAASRKVGEVGATDVRTVDHGMTGRIGGHDVAVGSPDMIAKVCAAPLPADKVPAGTSVVMVAVDGTPAGTILLTDTLKPGVAATISRLRSLGVKHVVILSGDAEGAVEAVARQTGADEWHAGLRPADKQRILAGLKASGRRTAFVGDGINDAPSLALADVGIAIGTGGTDVAMESADAVITGHSLSKLADAMALSRRIRRIVTQNLTLAIGTKAAVMILGAAGLATLWAAVFADTGITLLTVIWTLTALRR